MKIALALALVFPAIMAWLYFRVLAGDEAGQNPALVTAFGIGKSLQFALPVIAVWLFDRAAFKVRKPTWRGLWQGILFALLVGAGMLVLYHGWLKASPLTARTPAAVTHKLNEMGFGTPARFVVLALAISVVHSLLEEYYWRWFVFGQLKRFIPFWLAIVVSSLGFMAHHVIVLDVYFPEPPLAFWALVVPFSLGIAIGGGVWAWLYDRTGSFAAIWVSHCLVDGAIMLVGYDMVFGQ